MPPLLPRDEANRLMRRVSFWSYGFGAGFLGLVAVRKAQSLGKRRRNLRGSPGTAPRHPDVLHAVLCVRPAPCGPLVALIAVRRLRAAGHSPSAHVGALQVAQVFHAVCGMSAAPACAACFAVLGPRGDAVRWPPGAPGGHAPARRTASEGGGGPSFSLGGAREGVNG